MRRGLRWLLAFWAFASAHATPYEPPANNRADFNFNHDWKFIKQNATGAVAAAYDDSAWEPVNLPHTWNNDKFREWCATSNDPKQDPLRPSGTYYGLAWYRKHFTIDPAHAGKKIILEFEGIGRVANFYVNGVWVGLHENGVAPYGLDISSNVVFGADNVISIQVNNDENYKTVRYNGTGLPYGQPFNPNFGGLNRDVTLHICDRLHQTFPLYRDLGTVGVYVFSTNLNTLTRSATVTIQSEVRNDYASARTVDCAAVIVDRGGEPVASVSLGQQTLPAGSTATFSSGVALTNAHLWSPDYPYLYRVYTVLSTNGTPIDVACTPMGLRKFSFSKTAGLTVNGHPIYLKGYAPRCSMEWPCVGTPVDWMNEWDFQLMKENNANFVRPMHIAPRKVQVEAADKFGVVMVCPAANNEGDEANVDRWQQRLDIMRDVTVYFRNNPSVLFYEACNQALTAQHMRDMKNVRLTWDPNGGRLAGLRSNDGNVTQSVREYSATMDGTGRQLYNPCWDAEYARGESPRRVWDNYTPMLNPRWDGVSSSNRYVTGGYFYIASLYHQALGLNSGVGDFIGDYLQVISSSNGTSHAYFRLQNSEDMVLENLAKYYARYAQSAFVQASNVSSSLGVMVGGGKIIWSDSVTDGRMHDLEVTRVSGAVDGARLPKETFYGLQVAHNDEPQVYVVGHWNYPSNTVKTVYVAANTTQVGLRTYAPGGALLADYGLGTTNFFPPSILPPAGDQVNRYVFAFTNVVWQPGTITATGYSNGVPVATHSKKTVGAPASLKLTPMVGPAGQFRADGSDVAVFDVEVVDAEGNRCPTYEDRVTFACGGQGVFLGGYNSGIRYSTNLGNLTNGYSLNVECGINRVFVRSTRTAGVFTLTVSSSNGLAGATSSVTSTAFSVTAGLSPVWPQKYAVALGPEPAPVAEPPPTLKPPEPPMPATGTNISNLAYSGSHPDATIVQNAAAGMAAYMDSAMTLPELPGYLQGAEFIRPFQGDAGETSSTDQYQFDLTRYSYVYQLIDSANAMPNHNDNENYQWQQLPETVVIGGRTMNIFKSRLMAPYDNVYLAANGHGNSPFTPAGNMYLVFVASAEEQLINASTPVSVSSQEGANPGTKAVDGNLSSRWAAGASTNPQWIQFDLGNACALGGFQVFWQYSNNTYKYVIELSEDGSNFVTALDMQLNGTPGSKEFRIPSTGANSGRYVRVTVIAGGWASMYEINVFGMPSQLPPAPLNVSASATESSVVLSWSAAAGATSYNIKRSTSPGAEALIANVASLVFTDGNVSAGSTYYYEVSGSNSVGEGPASAEVNITPDAQGVLINCGSTSTYGLFVADTNYSGGTMSTHANAIDLSGVTNPAPAGVYQSYRLGNVAYNLANLPDRPLTVRLHFCETYFDAAGARVFSAYINGAQVITNLDIWTAAGGKNKALIREFPATLNGSNTLVISFNASVNSAAINGIEVNPARPLTAFQQWQIQYFGSTTNPLAAPDADATGSGDNNLYKYIAGLDPTNPSAVLQFQLAGATNGTRLSVSPAASNRVYEFQARADLMSESWAPVSGTTEVDGNQLSLVDTNPGLPMKHYGVRILMP